MTGYLNYGVNDPSRDFRDEMTELMNERITKALKDLCDNIPSYGEKDAFSWDITIGECPLGWDVCIYFKSRRFRWDIQKMMLVADTIAKAIGVKTSGSDYEWENVFEMKESFTKVNFCADIVPYKGE